jgi:membrane-associated phospholipid phosphatase
VRTGAPVIAWPGIPHLVRALGYSVAVAALFAAVFVGADRVTRLHAYRVDLSLPVDLVLPFVPEATLIYSSLYAMFALVPFILRTDREVRVLARSIAWEVVVAAPFFLALPMSEPSIPADLGRFAAAFRVADAINLQHNLFPSLHASFAFTVAAVLGRRSRLPGRAAFAAWSLAIAISTLLTRQHVIIDIAGALVLVSVVLWRAQKKGHLSPWGTCPPTAAARRRADRHPSHGGSDEAPPPGTAAEGEPREPRQGRRRRLAIPR